jgi:hypothetical protein
MRLGDTEIFSAGFALAIAIVAINGWNPLVVGFRSLTAVRVSPDPATSSGAAEPSEDAD